MFNFIPCLGMGNGKWETCVLSLGDIRKCINVFFHLFQNLFQPKILLYMETSHYFCEARDKTEFGELKTIIN